MVGIRVVAVFDIQAEADINHVASDECAVIEGVGEGGFCITIGHGLVVGFDNDILWRDGRLCRVDEDGIRKSDIIVLEIFAGEHVGREARACDGFGITDVLGVEVVFDAGVVELDIVAVDHLIHDEFVTFGFGGTVIFLVFGGETDLNLLRGDIRLRRFDEGDIVVLEVIAGEHGIVIAFCGDGLVLAGILGVEGVIQPGVVEVDVVAFEHGAHVDFVELSIFVAVIDLVVGGEANLDGELRDVRLRRIDEGDVIVLEIITGEHGVGVEAGGGDGLVLAGVLGVEIVFERGSVEVDIVAFENGAHVELVKFGDGVAVIDLVVGGESDLDGERRDVRLGRVVEREVVVVHVVADDDEFAVRRDGLVRADVLVGEGVGHICVEDADDVAVHEAVDGEVAVALGVGVAVIDLVLRVEDDGDVSGRDIQGGVVEGVVVVLGVGENMAVLDDHAGVEAGSHIAAGGKVAVLDLVVQRDGERVAGGEGVFVEGVLSVEGGHGVAVDHFLSHRRNGDVAQVDRQVAEVIDDVVVARDDVAVRVVDGGDGGDGIRVFAGLDVAGIGDVCVIDVET